MKSSHLWIEFALFSAICVSTPNCVWWSPLFRTMLSDQFDHVDPFDVAQELGAYVPELERSVLGNLGKRDAVDAAQFGDSQVHHRMHLVVQHGVVYLLVMLSYLTLHHMPSRVCITHILMVNACSQHCHSHCLPTQQPTLSDQGMPQRAGAFAAKEADVRVDWNFQMGQYAAAGLSSAHRAYK